MKNLKKIKNTILFKALPAALVLLFILGAFPFASVDIGSIITAKAEPVIGDLYLKTRSTPVQLSDFLGRNCVAYLKAGTSVSTYKVDANGNPETTADGKYISSGTSVSIATTGFYNYSPYGLMPPNGTTIIGDANTTLEEILDVFYGNGSEQNTNYANSIALSVYIKEAYYVYTNEDINGFGFAHVTRHFGYEDSLIKIKDEAKNDNMAAAEVNAWTDPKVVVKIRNVDINGSGTYNYGTSAGVSVDKYGIVLDEYGNRLWSSSPALAQRAAVYVGANCKLIIGDKIAEGATQEEINALNEKTRIRRNFNNYAPIINATIVESIKIDGNINDIGWKNADWITVHSGNGTHQLAAAADSSFSYDFAVRTDGTNFFVAAEFNVSSTSGMGETGTKLRIWLHNGDNTISEKTYTHFVDLYLSNDNKTAVAKLYKNSLKDGNSRTEVTNSGVTGAIKINTDIEKTRFELSVPLASFGGQNGFKYFVNGGHSANNINHQLLYPKTSDTAGTSGFPYSSWKFDKDIDIGTTQLEDLRLTETTRDIVYHGDANIKAYDSTTENGQTIYQYRVYGTKYSNMVIGNGKYGTYAKSALASSLLNIYHYGGGVFIDAMGVCVLESGAIEDNHSTGVRRGYGGAGVITFGHFEMNGGVIRNNSVTLLEDYHYDFNSGGGGVLVFGSGYDGDTAYYKSIDPRTNSADASESANAGKYSGTFRMNGGVIQENAAEYGGAVFSVARDENGYKTVFGDTADVNIGVEINGGRLTGNTARINGSAVYTGQSSSYKMNGGVITENINQGLYFSNYSISRLDEVVNETVNLAQVPGADISTQYYRYYKTTDGDYVYEWTNGAPEYENTVKHETTGEIQLRRYHGDFFDGELGETGDYQDGGWCSFYYANTDAINYDGNNGIVIVDLGRAYANIKTFGAYMHVNIIEVSSGRYAGKDGVGWAENCTVSVSLDGNNYSEVTTVEGFAAGSAANAGIHTGWYENTLPIGVAARYIKFDFKHQPSSGAFMMISELKILGADTEHVVGSSHDDKNVGGAVLINGSEAYFEGGSIYGNGIADGVWGGDNGYGLVDLITGGAQSREVPPDLEVYVHGNAINSKIKITHTMLQNVINWTDDRSCPFYPLESQVINLTGMNRREAVKIKSIKTGMGTYNGETLTDFYSDQKGNVVLWLLPGESIDEIILDGRETPQAFSVYGIQEAVIDYTDEFKVGTVLTASLRNPTAGTDSTSMTYQWYSYRNNAWAKLPNQTNSTYTLTQEDLNTKILVIVTSGDSVELKGHQEYEDVIYTSTTGATETGYDAWALEGLHINEYERGTNVLEIPENGAFSIRFDLEYFTGTDMAFNFSSALPAGTRLTLIDMCHKHESHAYYGYTVPAAGTNTVGFTSFIKSGTADVSFAAEHAAASNAQYVLTVQLPESGIEATELTVTMSKGGNALAYTDVYSTVEVPEGTELRNNPITVNFTNVTGNVEIKTPETGSGSINATVTLSNINKQEAAWDDDWYTTYYDVLVVTLLDENGNQVVLPATDIKINGNVPTYIRGASFWVSGVENGDYTVVIFGLPEGEYKLEATLCHTPEQEYPMSYVRATAVTEVLTVHSADAVKVTEAAGVRIVESASGATLNFTVQTMGDGTLSCVAKQKVNGLYEDYGSFTVTKTESGYTVAVPADIPAGTYRITFTFGDAVENYNIIVK